MTLRTEKPVHRQRCNVEDVKNVSSQIGDMKNVSSQIGDMKNVSSQIGDMKNVSSQIGDMDRTVKTTGWALPAREILEDTDT